MRRILRQQITDAVLLLLALSAGIAVLVTQHWQDNRPSEEPMGSLIPRLAESEPHSLVFKRAGRSVRLVNMGAGEDSPHWLVESPWKRGADEPAVDGVTTALRDMQVVRRLEIATTDLARVGLDRPQFTWEAEIEGSVWSVAFGAQAPSPRSGTYVDVTAPGSTVHQFYVVNADLAKLALEPEQLADRRLLTYVPSDFGSLTLQSGTRQVRYNFDDTRFRWFEAAEPHYRASRTAVEAFLLQLTTLKADRFVTRDAAATKHYTTTGALLTLGLRKSKTAIRVEFGGACEGQQNQSLVSISGANEGVACADVRSLLGDLEKGLADWKDTRVFSLRSDEIESFSIGTNGPRLKLERSESGFRLSNGGTVSSVSLEAGNQLLREVASVYGTLLEPAAGRAASFDGKRTLSLDSSVVGDLEHYEERADIGAPLPNGERYVRRGDDNAVLRISAQQAAVLLSDMNQLSSRPSLTDAGED